MSYLSANIERFTGFASLYDTHRPRPPVAVLEILTQLAGTPKPALVVDIGSGTGLSTALWADRADAVIGIEPSADMRHEAEQRVSALAGSANVRYQDGLSSATGLPDACADIVTCSQSLHWMEPAPTFAEIGRILRPGGIFAAYDCDWPPTVDWQVDQAYEQCHAAASALEHSSSLTRDVRHWNKAQHLERMQASGQFRFTKEIVLHHQEQGDAARLVGVMLSQGGIATLRKNGVSEDDLGITALRETAQRVLGDATWPWFWSYRMRVGVR